MIELPFKQRDAFDPARWHVTADMLLDESAGEETAKSTYCRRVAETLTTEPGLLLLSRPKGERASRVFCPRKRGFQPQATYECLWAHANDMRRWAPDVWDRGGWRDALPRYLHTPRDFTRRFNVALRWWFFDVLMLRGACRHRYADGLSCVRPGEGLDPTGQHATYCHLCDTYGVYPCNRNLCAL